MTQEIVRNDITSQAVLKEEMIRLSEKNPSKYITHYVSWGSTHIFIHDRKPQSINSSGAEDTYRVFGGFFKNGKIAQPSNTFKKQFNFCPVLG